MQYSVGVEYALHCLLHLAENSRRGNIGIKELATYQGVSETYLSKIFTKLKKAGILISITGVKGGYELAKLPDDISFWDVVEAVEGSSYNFQCHEIRQREIILDQSDLPESYEKCPCLIKTVMTEAEELMRDSLRKKSISWLQKEVSKKMSKELSDKKTEWFEK